MKMILDSGQQFFSVRLFITHLGTGTNTASVADPDDFLPDPDSGPDPNKTSDKFPQEIFCPKYALKSIFMNQKVKQKRFLKYFWLLHTPKKLI
jgi:hypothetical protein